MIADFHRVHGRIGSIESGGRGGTINVRAARVVAVLDVAVIVIVAVIVLVAVIVVFIVLTSARHATKQCLHQHATTTAATGVTLGQQRRKFSHIDHLIVIPIKAIQRDKARSQRRKVLLLLLLLYLLRRHSSTQRHRQHDD